MRGGMAESYAGRSRNIRCRRGRLRRPGPIRARVRSERQVLRTPVRRFRSSIGGCRCRLRRGCLQFLTVSRAYRPDDQTVADINRPGGTVVVQTVHPSAGHDGHGSTNGWRIETFACTGQAFPESMPWYHRTRESWLAVLENAGLMIGTVAEPQHPGTGAPLSLLIAASRTG